jgi:Protein of Unknown function (DUF2784)
MLTIAAALVLGLHLLVIAFNIAGLILIPLGARLGWRFVRNPTLRYLHLASLGITALQAALGQACFLTIWEASLLDRPDAPQPMIMAWVNSLIYWPLPIWVFAIAYGLAFAFVVALLWLVPVEKGKGAKRGA